LFAFLEVIRERVAVLLDAGEILEGLFVLVAEGHKDTQEGSVFDEHLAERLNLCFELLQDLFIALAPIDFLFWIDKGLEFFHQHVTRFDDRSKGEFDKLVPHLLRPLSVFVLELVHEAASQLLHVEKEGDLGAEDLLDGEHQIVEL